MPVGHVANQAAGATQQISVATMPAGTTLIRARLACYTYVETNNLIVGIQVAPANTLLGVYWKATGSAVPLVTPANMTNSQWYVAGFGEMDVFSRTIQIDRGQVPVFTEAQMTYATHLDMEDPDYEATSFDIGFSINFLGGGFWLNAISYLTWEFTYWYD